MASSKSPSPARTAPRLYLATPALEETTALASLLPPLLTEFDIAAVLLRLAAADERTLIARIKTLAGPVQAADAALLVDQHTNLVARAGADGAHVDGLQEMEEARFLGVALPRILLREPYADRGDRRDGFRYREGREGMRSTDYLWGNAAYAFAVVVGHAFSQSRWFAQIRTRRSDASPMRW